MRNPTIHKTAISQENIRENHRTTMFKGKLGDKCLYISESQWISVRKNKTIYIFKHDSENSEYLISK